MRIFFEHREKWVFALIVLIAVYFGYGRKSSETPVISDSIAVNQEFNKNVENFIMANPEVIIRSLEQMQIKKASEEQNRVSGLIKSKKEELENITTTPFLGNKDSKNIVIAFIDYNCDYCRKLNVILNALTEKNKDVRVAIKQLPIINEASFYMSKVALAIYNLHPEKFAPFHNAIFSHEYDMTKEKMQEIISGLEVDYAKVEEEMDSPRVRDEIKKIHDFANEAKINGVPAIIINDEAYQGVMQIDKIEELLTKPVKVEVAPEAKVEEGK
jgi:protein-disulfide isomerase